MNSLLIVNMIFTIYCAKSRIERFHHQNSLAYCARQNVALQLYLNEGKHFLGKALENDNFKLATAKIIECIGEKRFKHIIHNWEKIVNYHPIGAKYIKQSIDELIDNEIYRDNVWDFYIAMQNISKYIDFSNPTYKKIISALVDDLVLAIDPPLENILKLPSLNNTKVAKIIKKAIYIQKSLLNNNFDKISFKRINAFGMSTIEKKITELIENRDNINFEKITFDQNECSNNGPFYNLIYRKGQNMTKCNKDWIYCDGLSSFSLDHGNQVLISGTALPLFD